MSEKIDVDGPKRNSFERLTQPLWPDTGKQLGLGRNATYDAAARGEIPGLITIGRKKLVVKEVFLRRLSEGGKAA